METLFYQATIREENASTSQLQTLIQMYRQDLLTGLMEVTHPPDIQILLLFVEGAPVIVYLMTPELLKRIQPADLTPLIAQGESKIRVAPLPLDGLRATKILVESRKLEQTIQADTVDLSTLFGEWEAQPRITIAHVQWKNAEAVAIFPGNSGAADPIIFLGNDEVKAGTEALSYLSSWNETTCEITLYTQQTGSEASLEYTLHTTFSQTLEQIITRYNELAGRSLVTMLNRDINSTARLRGWQINSFGSQVIDNQVFASTEIAALSYKTIVEVCLNHIDSVLGSHLTDSIVQQTTRKLNQGGLDIIRNYQLVPKWRLANL